MNKALRSTGVLAFSVFQPDLKECNWGPLFQGTLSTGYQRPISEQSQNKQQTKLKFDWAMCPRKPATHELTPWGEEKGKKKFHKQTEERKRQSERMAPHWLDPTWMSERQSLRKNSFLRLAQERGSNLLTYLESNKSGDWRPRSLTLLERRWLWFMY